MIVTLLFFVFAAIAVLGAGNLIQFLYLVNWLKRINYQVGRILTMNQQVLDLLKKIDDETNAVAAEIERLRAQVTTGMSDADVTALQARLTAVSDKLTGLAADPANPVPETPALGV